MPNEPLNYQLNFRTDSAGIADAQAQLDKLKQTTGTDLPEAAEKAKSGFSGFLKGAREDVHPFHAGLRLIEQTTGMIGLAVTAVIGIWEAYNGTSEKVIEATTKELEENLKLKESLEGIKDAGGKLTESQNELLSSTERLTKIQAVSLMDALTKKRDAASEELKATAAEIAEQEKIAASYVKTGQSTDGLTQGLLKLKVRLDEQSQAYHKVQDDLAAVQAGFSGSTDKIKADTDAAKANEAAKKAASDAAKKAAQDDEKAAADRLNADIKANDDVAKEQSKAIAERLKDKKLSNDQIKALYDADAQAQIDALNKNSDIQAQILQKQYDAQMISKKQFDAKMIALEQETNDKVAALDDEAASKKTATDTAEMNSELQSIQTVEQAGTAAYVKKMQQTGDIKASTEAALGDMIKAAADAAAKDIEIKGLQAAADAYAGAGNPYLGAVEAAAVLAWYSALAAGVGAAGSAIASASNPPSGAASGSGGTSTPAQSSAVQPSGSAQPVNTNSFNTTQPSGPSANVAGGNLNITVNLDSQPILKAVQQASFNGNIQISANAVT